jgi:hypothetical protein
VRIEQVSPFRRKRQSALAVAEVNQFDDPLVVEVVNGAVGNIEVMFWDDAERTDDGQRTAVFAVKLLDSVAVNDQFALVTARQVDVDASGHPEDRVHPGRASRTRAAIRRRDHARRIRADHPIGRRTSEPPWVAIWVIREDALAVAA